jgi:hypothetical protein
MQATMTAKHADPEYRKNARIIRQQVTRQRRLGHEITCWRCGSGIHEEQTYDVGHIDPHAGHSIDNLAPEHRYKSGHCQGNRAAGGRMGSAIQRSRHNTAKRMLPW